jgi:3-dehydroquinate dehydratase-2
VHILVINGPNLNLLGIREPAIYGRGTYDDLCALIRQHADALGVTAEFFQSNHEGALVDAIQGAYGRADGIVINPGAYTHTSVALLDAVKAVGIPTVEVHISDPDTREPFRRISFIRAACAATIKGRGFQGYLDALDLLCRPSPAPGQPV